MNRRTEDFTSPTDPKFLALMQADVETDKDLTEADIEQEWHKEINSLPYSVFGIRVNDRTEYFGSKRDEARQKISNYKGTGLAKEILTALGETEADNASISIDPVTNDLVIALPGEPATRIPEDGEPYSV